MANHAYVRVPRPLKTGALLGLLHKVNEERFGGRLKVEKHEDCLSIEGLPVWMSSPRKIEIRHQLGGDVGWWIDVVVCNDLALMTGGKISDDGGDGTWEGVKGKYPSAWALKASLLSSMGKPNFAVKHMCQEWLVREIQSDYPHLEEMLMEGIEDWRSGKLFLEGSC